MSLQCHKVCTKRWIWSNKVTGTGKYWYYFLAIEENNNCISESWSLLLEKLFVILDFNTAPLCYIAPLKVTFMSLTALMENCTLLKQCGVKGDQGIRNISILGGKCTTIADSQRGHLTRNNRKMKDSLLFHLTKE